jgi:hypothetical protein
MGKVELWGFPKLPHNYGNTGKGLNKGPTSTSWEFIRNLFKVVQDIEYFGLCIQKDKLMAF